MLMKATTILHLADACRLHDEVGRPRDLHLLGEVRGPHGVHAAHRLVPFDVHHHAAGLGRRRCSPRAQRLNLGGRVVLRLQHTDVRDGLERHRVLVPPTKCRGHVHHRLPRVRNQHEEQAFVTHHDDGVGLQLLGGAPGRRGVELRRVRRTDIGGVVAVVQRAIHVANLKRVGPPQLVRLLRRRQIDAKHCKMRRSSTKRKRSNGPTVPWNLD